MTGWVGWCVVGWVGWWAGGRYSFGWAGGGGGGGGRGSGGVEGWRGPAPTPLHPTLHPIPPHHQRRSERRGRGGGGGKARERGQWGKVPPNPQDFN